MNNVPVAHWHIWHRRTVKKNRNVVVKIRQIYL